MIFIDIGGSTIWIYRYKDNEGRQRLIESKRLNTPKVVGDIYKILNRVEEEAKSENYVVIGIPGPVNRSIESIYCPPLENNINCDAIKGIFHDSEVFIGNDLLIHSIFSVVGEEANKSGDVNAEIITLGTSLGHASVYGMKEKGYVVITHESAHQNLSYETKKSLITRKLDKDMFKTRKDILSYAGFHALIENIDSHVIQKSENNNKLAIGLIVNEIEEICTSRGYFTSIVIGGGLANKIEESKELSERIRNSIRENKLLSSKICKLVIETPKEIWEAKEIIEKFMSPSLRAYNV